MRSLKHFTALVLLSACTLTRVWAMTLTPIETQLTPSGRGASSVFRLSNTGPDAIAVDFSVKSRQMSRNGQDVLGDAESDFIIVPSQISLQPGQVQSVRVQYVGDATLSQEKAYRLIAEQLPLDPASATKAAATPNAGVRLLIKYVASVYVTPPRAKPTVELVQLSLLPKTDKAPVQIEVTLKNIGQAHVILSRSSLQFRIAGKPYTLSAEQLTGLESENLLAGTERVFKVSWPASVPEAPAISAPTLAQDAGFKQN